MRADHGEARPNDAPGDLQLRITGPSMMRADDDSACCPARRHHVAEAPSVRPRREPWSAHGTERTANRRSPSGSIPGPSPATPRKLSITGGMAILGDMPMMRLALVLLVFLLLSAAGTASAHGRNVKARDVASTVLSATASTGSKARLSMVAANDQSDDACDDDGCRDGQCGHRCNCGCNMGSCASPSVAVVAQPWTFRWISTSEPAPAFHPRHPAAARGASPLRPPIA